MPILVKHGGSPGASALGAYGGGQGKRQAQDTRQAASTAAREREAERRRESIEKQREAQRKLRSSEAEKSRDFRRELAGDRQASEDARLEQQTRQKQMDRRFDVGMEQSRREWKQGQVESERRFEIDRLSAEQKQKVKGWERAYTEAVESGKYDEDTLAEWRQQIDAQKMGLEASKESEYDDSMELGGHKIGDTWTDESGNRMTVKIGKNGVPEYDVLGEDRTVPTPGERLEAAKLAREMAGVNDMGGTDRKAFMENMKLLGFPMDGSGDERSEQAAPAAGGQGASEAGQPAPASDDSLASEQEAPVLEQPESAGDRGIFGAPEPVRYSGENDYGIVDDWAMKGFDAALEALVAKDEGGGVIPRTKEGVATQITRAKRGDPESMDLVHKWAKSLDEDAQVELRRALITPQYIVSGDENSETEKSEIASMSWANAYDIVNGSGEFTPVTDKSPVGKRAAHLAERYSVSRLEEGRSKAIKSGASDAQIQSIDQAIIMRKRMLTGRAF